MLGLRYLFIYEGEVALYLLGIIFSDLYCKYFYSQNLCL